MLLDLALLTFSLHLFCYIRFIVFLVNVRKSLLFRLFRGLHLFELIFEREYHFATEADVLFPLHIEETMQIFDLITGEAHATNQRVGPDTFSDKSPLISELRQVVLDKEE